MHPDTWYYLFGSPIMADAVWCIPTRGIIYSVLPSCRMPFSASRHVVLLIRFSHHGGCRLVHPDTWYHLFGSPIMSDAVWCIPTRGIIYSVLPSCRMSFSASRHVVSIKCHTPSRRMPIGASRQVGHFFNAICHHDGCRLVHPAKWDIGKFRGAFMTDAVWCIPSGGSFFITFNLHLRRIPFNESHLYYYSRSFGFRISHFNFVFTLTSTL